MDQTGVHLVPCSSYTYEAQGSASVAVVGSDDKRQITVCLASALDGTLLPLQLIFQGKTARSLPAVTPSSLAVNAHLTCSENHWSSQVTMQQWVSEVLMPYADRCIQQHRLHSDAHIVLLLDVWAVHKSEEFRKFLRTHHPRVHLVFVPANCTSKLQVADVALQRPFKHGITKRFNEWAAQEIREQIKTDNVTGLASSLKMSNIKPLVLEWAVQSWNELKERKQLIIEGWSKSCTSLFNVQDPDKRLQALAAVAKNELDQAHVPEEEEQDAEEEGDSENESEISCKDSSGDELDLAQPRTFGARRSTRTRNPPAQHGYQLSSVAIALSGESELEH